MGTDVFNHPPRSPRQLNKNINIVKLSLLLGALELTSSLLGVTFQWLGYLRQLLSHERRRYRLNWKCSSLFKLICSKQTYYTIIDVWCYGKIILYSGFFFFAISLVYNICMKGTLFVRNTLIAKKNNSKNASFTPLFFSFPACCASFHLLAVS